MSHCLGSNEDGLLLVPQERVHNRVANTRKVFTVRLHHHRDDQACVVDTVGFIKGLDKHIMPRSGEVMVPASQIQEQIVDVGGPGIVREIPEEKVVQGIQDSTACVGAERGILQGLRPEVSSTTLFGGAGGLPQNGEVHAVAQSYGQGASLGYWWCSMPQTGTHSANCARTRRLHSAVLGSVSTCPSSVWTFTGPVLGQGCRARVQRLVFRHVSQH